eukprot:TRINITY_DN82069_c0_g1_i1.p1 TRINITY_DN82069_c0_g1~~TRINITY_DN82069_c0_g1_i1.p1  ORF type:complete len:421 (+),score=60.39 TRINITY_DN82069_c0_g1_i1:49-1311(+)
MASRQRKVAVVGAGVAGLVCARELETAGVDVDLFEAAARVGGRVQTEDLEGYQLDVGFQILIDAYPEVRRQLNLPALKLRCFAPGAVLALRGRLSRLAHPLKCPGMLFQTIRTAFKWGLLGTCSDILRLLRLAMRWLFTGPYSALEASTQPEDTASFLTRMGFSFQIVQGFLRPFFEAIYVSPLREQSVFMFEFVLRMLATGRACLPERGMRAIPEQLAASLQKPVKLSSIVEEVGSSAVKVNGVWQNFDAVVVAAEWPAAAKLLNLPVVAGTRSSTWYFGLPSPAPVLEPLIVLQSYGTSEETAESRVVNIGFPSVVQQSYAPRGRELAAVTVMGQLPSQHWVRTEIERILDIDVSTWHHLRTYDISYHQPAQVPLKRFEGLSLQVDGVSCCGDHCSNPTLDGAMRSGRFAAAAVLRSL